MFSLNPLHMFRAKRKGGTDLSTDATSPSAVKNRDMRTARTFADSKSGNVAIIFGLLAVPLVSMAGLSVDYTNAIRERARIQAALDSAALAAGRRFQVTGSITEAKAAAANYFERLTGYTLTVNTVDNSSFVLTVGSQEDIPTSFMGVLGESYDKLTVHATSKALLAQQGQNVEVSLMLDTTGSMSGGKMVDLKAAAKDLVNIVIQDDQSEYTSRVALAPFAHSVNVGSYFAAFTNQGQINSNCVVERTGSEKYTDAPPGTGAYFRRYDNLDWFSSNYSCAPGNSTIQPLSDNKVEINTSIDNLPTWGATAGHLGTAWAWYLISPNWADVFPPENAPSDTFTETKKIAVLMSDGIYNRDYSSGVSSDTQADTLCGNMKASGIEVYAVGFELSEGSSAYQTLQQCATDEVHFFPASDGEELKDAFRTIAFKIAELRLVE